MAAVTTTERVRRALVDTLDETERADLVERVLVHFESNSNMLEDGEFDLHVAEVVEKTRKIE